MIRSFRETYSGTGTAGRFAMIPLQDGEDLTIDKLSPDNFDERYKAIVEQAKSDIFSVFSAPPVIFGIYEKTGFAEQNYDEAFNLYSRVRVRPKQEIIERTFNRILGEGFLKIIPIVIETKEDKELKKIAISNEK